jgi:Zn-dependent peptidase ImmA (M78 family)
LGIAIGSVSIHGKRNRRQRFTIAHELGHFFLHSRDEHVTKAPMVMLRSGASSTGLISEEIQANQFAAELLMPREAVGLLVEEYDIIDDDVIDSLACNFEVSPQAMAIRLGKLGYIY